MIFLRISIFLEKLRLNDIKVHLKALEFKKETRYLHFSECCDFSKINQQFSLVYDNKELPVKL